MGWGNDPKCRQTDLPFPRGVPEAPAEQWLEEAMGKGELIQGGDEERGGETKGL